MTPATRLDRIERRVHRRRRYRLSPRARDWVEGIGVALALVGAVMLGGALASLLGR